LNDFNIPYHKNMIECDRRVRLQFFVLSLFNKPGSGVKRRNFVLITFHLSTEFDYNMMQEIVLT